MISEFQPTSGTTFLPEDMMLSATTVTTSPSFTTGYSVSSGTFTHIGASIQSFQSEPGSGWQCYTVATVAHARVCFASASASAGCFGGGRLWVSLQLVLQMPLQAGTWPLLAWYAVWYAGMLGHSANDFLVAVTFNNCWSCANHCNIKKKCLSILAPKHSMLALQKEGVHRL